MSESREPKTLEEWLADGMRQTSGLKCPHCHCPDLRVSYKRSDKGALRRVRICRHCGRRVVTFESLHAS